MTVSAHQRAPLANKHIRCEHDDVHQEVKQPHAFFSLPGVCTTFNVETEEWSSFVTHEAVSTPVLGIGVHFHVGANARHKGLVEVMSRLSGENSSSRVHLHGQMSDRVSTNKKESRTHPHLATENRPRIRSPTSRRKTRNFPVAARLTYEHVSTVKPSSQEELLSNTQTHFERQSSTGGS